MSDKQKKIFNLAVCIEKEWSKWLSSPVVMPTKEFLESIEELVTTVLGRDMNVTNPMDTKK